MNLWHYDIVTIIPDILLILLWFFFFWFTNPLQIAFFSSPCICFIIVLMPVLGYFIVLLMPVLGYFGILWDTFDNRVDPCLFFTVFSVLYIDMQQCKQLKGIHCYFLNPLPWRCSLLLCTCIIYLYSERSITGKILKMLSRFM